MFFFCLQNICEHKYRSIRLQWNGPMPPLCFRCACHGCQKWFIVDFVSSSIYYSQHQQSANFVRTRSTLCVVGCCVGVLQNLQNYAKYVYTPGFHVHAWKPGVLLTKTAFSSIFELLTFFLFFSPKDRKSTRLNSSH